MTLRAATLVLVAALAGTAPTAAAAVTVAFDRGRILAYEGTTPKVVGAYEVGRWYHVRLGIDTVNQRFDLWIDGRLLIEKGRFRASMPALGSIAYYANSSNYGQAHVDDVSVGYGRPAR